MKPIVVLALVAMSICAHADETCVRLAAGTAVSSAPAKDAVVGRMKAAAIGSVDKQADWLRVRLEAMKEEAQGLRYVASAAVLFVKRAKVTRARCPAPANLAVLGLARDFLELHWKDGSEAGNVPSPDVLAAAAASRDYIDLAGEKNVCFDAPIVPELTAHVCGSCAKLRDASGPGSPGLPCSEN